MRETKMLKWLKQKQPTIGGAMTTEKITDDVLATIHLQKKSKNKSNEIYAVSRVNPLFEEDAKGVFSPGNNSGSSGYDSGPSDDDFPGSTKLPTNPAASSERLSSVLSITKPPQLFRDKDDFVIHHEASLVGPNGQPILQILQQNPNFVKSIAVAVPSGRRPLSPIDESSNNRNYSHDAVKTKTSSSSSPRVSAIPVPQRNANNGSYGDSTGMSKIIQKDTRYVQSIRIGPSGGLRGQQGHFSSAIDKVKHHHSNNNKNREELKRKPSVTFSERVDVLADGNLNVPRRISTTDSHDSIVTDSLLLLTSQNDNHTNNNRRVSLLADFNNRRRASGNLANNKSGSSSNNISSTNHHHKSSSNNNSSNKNISSSSENELSEDNNKDTADLQAFANSLKKSRPVKQMVSIGRSIVESHSSSSGSSRRESDNDDRQITSRGVTDDDDGDHDNDERSESSSQQESPVRPRTPRSAAKRSPFGGIADHYAAAKEIAKEIESYSVGTSKSTKRSMVRDLLLSSRGRGSSSSSNLNQLSHHQNTRNEDSTSAAVNLDGPNFGKHHQRQPRVGEIARVHDGLLYVKENSTTPRLSTSPEGQDHIIQSHSEQRLVSWEANRQTKEFDMNAPRDYYFEHEYHDYETFYRRLSDPSEISSDGGNSPPSTPDRVPIYDALPRTVSHVHHEDSDSGNSSDRSPGEIRLEMGEDEDGEPHLVLAPSIQRDNFPNKAHSSSSSTSSSDESRQSSSSSSNNSTSDSSRVMIVSGDSQNMVVDLSAVPPDLREAIMAGTALITLPSGVKKRLEPGYTMIAMPSSNSSSSSDLKDPDQIIKLSDSGSDSPLSQSKFGTKNKAQIWNVMQHQHISATLTSVGGKGFRGKDKKITTVLPFHPNHETSPDFTIEGQRLKMQMKKTQIAKTRRCYCRIFGILFFLIAFLGILVGLSMLVTRGERIFGSV